MSALRFRTAAEIAAEIGSRDPMPPSVPVEPEALTWDELVRAEPLLVTLLAEAASVRAKGRRFCANDVWFRDFKPRLRELVGYEAHVRAAQPDWLRGQRAFEVAYEEVYAALPNCRACSCA